MAAPVNALRPIPDRLPQSALVTHAVFYARIAADPEFRSFMQAHDEKITRLFQSVVAAVQSLGAPDARQIAKKLFNGPIQIVIVKPSERMSLQICENDQSLQAREAVSDEEVEASVRDWTVRVVAICQEYILTSDLHKVSSMLGAGDYLKASFLALPRGAESSMGFLQER